MLLSGDGDFESLIKYLKAGMLFFMTVTSCMEFQKTVADGEIISAPNGPILPNTD